MDLGETIRKQVHDAVEAALRGVPKNVASARNVSGSSHTVSTVSTSGHTVSVYVDDEVTIVERDGKRRVIRHDEDDASGTAGDAAAGDAPAGGSAGDAAEGGEEARPGQE